MLKVGDQVRFVPYAYLRCRGNDERTCGRRPEDYIEVTGTVVYINETNLWFLAEYGERTKMRMGFKFQDLGESVQIVGKKITIINNRLPPKKYITKPNEYREQSAVAAQELYYGEDTVRRILKANNDTEISNILVSARKRKFDSDL